MSNYKPIFLTATLVGGLLLAYSCHKPANTPESDTAVDQPKILTTQPLFHKAIGAPMLRTTANVWKQRYQRTHKLAAVSNYRLQAMYLKALLQQTPEVVGIAFCWVQTAIGVDLVPIAVNAKGYLIKTPSLTSARGQVWSWAEVIALWDKYQGATKALIFGSNTFTRLIDEQGTETMLLEPAINNKGEEILVLSNAATPDSEYVEDESGRCPPFCPIDNNTL